MAVELPETTINIIRKNLVEIGDQLDSALIDEQLKLETIEDKKEKIWKENIIDKTKTTLANDEKKRLLEISKIFVKTWIESIKKFKEQQKKKNLLTGAISAMKKKVTAPFRFISDFLKKKKKKQEDKPKKKMSWMTKLLLIIAGLGAAWFLFKNLIKNLPSHILEPLKGVGNAILDLLKISWDIVCKATMDALSGVWNWIKESLHLDAIGNFFVSCWDAVSGWFSSIWDKITKAWTTLKDAVFGLPGKIWDWISSAAKSIFGGIIDAISAAWNFIKDVVVKFWDWICGQLKNIWEGYKKAWKKVAEFFSGIWGWIKDTFSFSNIWKYISGWFNKKVNEWKELFSALFEGRWGDFALGLAKQALNVLTGGMASVAADAWGKLTEWWNSDQNKTKEQVKTKVTTDVKRVIEKQEEIKLKDNILETVKDICDRINAFFSGNKNGFIELSNRLVNSIIDGFTNMEQQLNKVKLNNTYNISITNRYSDKYDQSDHSTNTLSIDYSDRSTHHVQAITIDLPDLKNTVDNLAKQVKEEVNALKTQNQYFVSLLNNLSAFGTDINTKCNILLENTKDLDKDNSGSLTVAIGNSVRRSMNPIDTTDMRQAQYIMSRAFT